MQARTNAKGRSYDIVFIKYLASFHHQTLYSQYFYRLNSGIAWKRTKCSNELLIHLLIKLVIALNIAVAMYLLPTKYGQKELFGHGFIQS